MANTKDINSTEKLLNVIRGTQKSYSLPGDEPKQVDSSKKISNKQVLKYSKALTGKSRFTLGVDIGHDHLYFAKTAKMSDGKPLLVDQKIINRKSVV